MRYRFHTLDVFTTERFSGNPLAVFPDASGISDARMQDVAREFNLSETVFMLRPEQRGNTRRLRIFTPAGELPFAGHPTIGSAVLLAHLDEELRAEAVRNGGESRIVLEEGAGEVAVTIRVEDGEPCYARLTAARNPEMRPGVLEATQIADLLSLDASDVCGGRMRPIAVSCGNPFLLVPLVSELAVARARLNIPLWELMLRGSWAPEPYIFSVDERERVVRARLFAPGLGIGEDPATGSAAVAVAGYLAALDPASDATLRWHVRQGIEIGRPSDLYIEADKRDGVVTATRVGGYAVLVSEGDMDISP